MASVLPPQVDGADGEGVGAEAEAGVRGRGGAGREVGVVAPSSEHSKVRLGAGRGVVAAPEA